MPRSVDLVITPRWLIPIEPAGLSLQHHALVIDHGRIVDLLPANVAMSRYQAREHCHLPEHVLLPGLVNAHGHAAMNLLRGYADDLPLSEWLQTKIWPAEGRHVSERFVFDGTLLACAEMLRAGITCSNDMYFFPQAAAAAFKQAGMRAVIGMTIINVPTAYASDADDYLSKGLAARDAWRADPLLSFSLAPHAPYSVDDDSFRRIAMLADQLDLPIHVHVHETRAEIEQSLREFGCRPLARLHELGVLGPNTIAVHAVHLEAMEIALLAELGVSVAHCPTSNLKLASGMAPLHELLAAGVCVALGSDGAASNNRLDLLREMQLASLLAKVNQHDAATVSAHQALRMATLNGARALGLAHEIGTLEIGKAADMCAIRLIDPLLAPCFDAAAHVVHVAGREQVSHVWVAGQLRVHENDWVDLSAQQLLDIATVWQNTLSDTYSAGMSDRPSIIDQPAGFQSRGIQNE